MARLQKKDMVIFANDTLESGQMNVIGNRNANSTEKTNDINVVQKRKSVIQGGLNQLVVNKQIPLLDSNNQPVKDSNGNNIMQKIGAPILEDFDSELSASTYNIAYMHSEGCALEYSETQNYNKGAIVREKPSSTQNLLTFYISKKDNNINQPLSNKKWWFKMVNATHLGKIATGINMNATFDVSFQGNTRIISAVDIFFKSLADDSQDAFISYDVQTIVAPIGNISVRGIYTLYIGYRYNPTNPTMPLVVWKNSSTWEGYDKDDCILARCTLTYDGQITNIISVVQMPYYNSSEINVLGNEIYASIGASSSNNLTLRCDGGSIKGNGVGYGTTNPFVKIMPITNTLNFYIISPADIDNLVLPNTTNTLIPNEYYNPITKQIANVSNNLATVQRVLLSPTGVFYVQRGEATYSSLKDAFDGMIDSPFSTIELVNDCKEVCRIAIVGNATNTNSNSQALFRTITTLGTNTSSIPVHNSLVGVNVIDSKGQTSTALPYHIDIDSAKQIDINKNNIGDLSLLATNKKIVVPAINELYSTIQANLLPTVPENGGYVGAQKGGNAEYATSGSISWMFTQGMTFDSFPPCECAFNHVNLPIADQIAGLGDVRCVLRFGTYSNEYKECTMTVLSGTYAGCKYTRIKTNNIWQSWIPLVGEPTYLSKGVTLLNLKVNSTNTPSDATFTLPLPSKETYASRKFLIRISIFLSLLISENAYVNQNMILLSTALYNDNAKKTMIYQTGIGLGKSGKTSTSFGNSKEETTVIDISYNSAPYFVYNYKTTLYSEANINATLIGWC